MTESFRTYRQIGTPRDRLALIDCLPSQAVRRGPKRFVDDRATDAFVSPLWRFVSFSWRFAISRDFFA